MNGVTFLAMTLPPHPSDTKFDVPFNRLDIVQVLRTAKYLTAEQVRWDESGWIGDSVFDRLDIVAALQTESQLHEPYAGN